MVNSLKLLTVFVLLSVLSSSVFAMTSEEFDQTYFIKVTKTKTLDTGILTLIQVCKRENPNFCNGDVLNRTFTEIRMHEITGYLEDFIKNGAQLHWKQTVAAGAVVGAVGGEAARNVIEGGPSIFAYLFTKVTPKYGAPVMVAVLKIPRLGVIPFILGGTGGAIYTNNYLNSKTVEVPEIRELSKRLLKDLHENTLQFEKTDIIRLINLLQLTVQWDHVPSELKSDEPIRN